MNPMKYGDDLIDETEFLFAIPSVILGVSFLTLPHNIAAATLYSDGWVVILLSGISFSILALLGVQVASQFPNKSFYEYSTTLLTKPIALLVTICFIILNIFISSDIVGSVSFISQRYLFDKTPMEVLGLIFLLVVVYAVSGSRVGLLRLNMLFLPIILGFFIIVSFLNMKWYNLGNFAPLFKTDIQGYLKGVNHTFTAFAGFEIVLFYFFLIRKPKKVHQKIIIGMSISTLFYIAIFFMCIGIFGNLVTSNLLFPTIEATKRVYIPGAIFERIDAFVFTIWVMAFFNTVAIFLDFSVLLIKTIFTKLNKKIITFILSPIVYYLAMFPQQIDIANQFTMVLGQIHTYFTMAIILLLFLIVNIRKWRSS